MKSGQKDIFYLTGSSKEQLEKSPFLEQLTKKNYEVFSFESGSVVLNVLLVSEAHYNYATLLRSQLVITFNL